MLRVDAHSRTVLCKVTTVKLLGFLAAPRESRQKVNASASDPVGSRPIDIQATATAAGGDTGAGAAAGGNVLPTTSASRCTFQRGDDYPLDIRASIEVGWYEGQSLDELQFKIIPFRELHPTASSELCDQDEYLFDAEGEGFNMKAIEAPAKQRLKGMERRDAETLEERSHQWSAQPTAASLSSKPTGIPHRQALLIQVSKVHTVKHYRVRNGDIFDSFPALQMGHTDIPIMHAYYALMLLRFNTVSNEKRAPPPFTQEPNVEEITATHRYGYHADDWFRAYWAILAFQTRRLENKHFLDSPEAPTGMHSSLPRKQDPPREPTG
ncbi:hypothetical protein DL771_009973 [Monosporascus sp. 5C6A]|nr:hypothetical protein DL771_009973 [Monosporascus sp. 5C6A]